jgi:hypothetical protein
VQVQNPGGTKSNAVSLVVAAPNGSDEIISLTSTVPIAMAKDIVVVEPTTAGVSVPGNDVDLNVAALGTFSVANNSCALTGNPVVLLRPASGTSTADICLFAESGLDTSMTFSVSGADPRCGTRTDRAGDHLAVPQLHHRFGLAAAAGLRGARGRH